MSISDSAETDVDQVKCLYVNEFVEGIARKRIQFLLCRKHKLDLLALKIARRFVFVSFIVGISQRDLTANSVRRRRVNFE